MTQRTVQNSSEQSRTFPMKNVHSILHLGQWLVLSLWINGSWHTSWALGLSKDDVCSNFQNIIRLCMASMANSYVYLFFCLIFLYFKKQIQKSLSNFIKLPVSECVVVHKMLIIWITMPSLWELVPYCCLRALTDDCWVSDPGFLVILVYADFFGCWKIIIICPKKNLKFTNKEDTSIFLIVFSPL